MLEIDHIIPGEPETQLLCGDCNRIKATLSMDVFRQRLAHLTEKDAQWLTELETSSRGQMADICLYVMPMTEAYITQSGS